jgi:hypothetical protein
MFNNFFSENRAVYVIAWTNILDPGRPQMTIRHMRFTCWVPKVTNTPSEYVILTTFPRQQWLRERSPLLRYMYNACRY